jgi:hypothetical protein
METVTAFCVKCNRMREMIDVETVEMPRGGKVEPALKGVCVVCGTGMYKILSRETE